MHWKRRVRPSRKGLRIEVSVSDSVRPRTCLVGYENSKPQSFRHGARHGAVLLLVKFNLTERLLSDIAENAVYSYYPLPIQRKTSDPGKRWVQLALYTGRSNKWTVRGGISRPQCRDFSCLDVHSSSLNSVDQFNSYIQVRLSLDLEDHHMKDVALR
jgi:hypothetical protein